MGWGSDFFGARRRPRQAWLAGLAALAFAALLAPPAFAADVILGEPDMGNYGLHVTSFAEMPFRSVIRQKYDYSCGSAALATLLRYQYSRDTNEAQIFKSMYATGDQARIQKLGFSLLDMKSYLAGIGYKADGYRMSLDQLAQTGLPAIALIQIGSYKHFVVVKGVVKGHVLVGDPAQGLREINAADFQKAWNGIAFVVHDAPASVQAPLFNSAGDWQRWADSHPLNAAMLNAPLAPVLRDLRVVYQIEPNQILPNPFQP